MDHKARQVKGLEINVPEWRAWPAETKVVSPSQPSGEIAAEPDIPVPLAACPPPHPSALQILVVSPLLVEFLRHREGRKCVMLLQVPVPQEFPSKIPSRVKPDIGMTTYLERNYSLNIETILLMHFKETTL